MEQEGEGETNCNWCTRNYPQNFEKEAGRVGNWRTRGDHLNYSIVEVGQNTEKCPRDPRRFSVTQNSVRDHQLMHNNNNTQKNINCKLCGDRAEIINRTIN